MILGDFPIFPHIPARDLGGLTTAAGMYQITVDTWHQHGGKMGLTDFSPKTQDLMTVEILRSIGVIEKIKAGDVAGAMGPAAANEIFYQSYVSAGGTGK